MVTLKSQKGFPFLIALLLLLLLISGCIPQKDIFKNYLGEWQAYDNAGFLDYGCKTYIHNNRRYISFWEYSGRPEASVQTLELSHFKLKDQYSRNYSSEYPTWLYIYRPGETAYPAFVIEEFYSGNLRPALVRNGPVTDEERGDDDSYPRIPLKETSGILSPQFFDSDFLKGKSPEDLSLLSGQYFLIRGKVIGIINGGSSYSGINSFVRSNITYTLEPFTVGENIFIPEVVYYEKPGYPTPGNINPGDEPGFYVRLRHIHLDQRVLKATFILQYLLSD